MQKKLGLVLIMIFLFCFASCKKDQEQEVKKEYKLVVVYDEIYGNQEINVSSSTYDLTLLTKFSEDHRRVVGFSSSVNGDLLNNTLNINSDTTIYAVWDYDKYTYTFYDSDRTTIIKEVTDNYGSTIAYPSDLADQAHDGYTSVFKGWSRKDTILTNNIRFYPVFERINDTFDVIFYDYDNEVLESFKIEYGDYVRELSDPNTNIPQETYFYQFDGWFDENDEKFDFDKQITKSVNLYPKCTIGEYTTTSLEDATISILGDSISTFYAAGSEINSIYQGDNQFYYPRYSSTVTTVDKTWWYQTIKGVGAKFGIINSLSGSCAYGTSGAGQSTGRLKNLGVKGVVNIVLVFLGTNDNVNGFTTQQVKSAFKVIIEYIQENYVECRDGKYIKPIVYLFTLGYSAYSGYSYTDETRLEYNNMIRSLATEYDNVRIFDLATYITSDNYSTYLGDYLHYNATGMSYVSQKLIEQLKSDFGVPSEPKTKNKEIKIIYYLKKEDGNII